MKRISTNTLDKAFIVHRKISIPTIQENDSRTSIGILLSEIKAIHNYDFNENRKTVQITYDNSLIGFGDIERSLTECGHPISNSWWSKYKSGWYRYLDENAKANAKIKGSACCSNPSDIYAKRHK